MHVKVKEGIWQGVRAKERREAMKEWEEGREVYKQRYKIEQVIGLIKKSYGDVCGERYEEMAKKAIMMRLILWNMAVLLAMGFTGFRFFCYSQVLLLKWLGWLTPFARWRIFRTLSHLREIVLKIPFVSSCLRFQLLPSA